MDFLKYVRNLLNWAVPDDTRKRRASSDFEFSPMSSKYRRTAFMDSPQKSRIHMNSSESFNDFRFGSSSDRHSRHRWDEVKENLIEISDDEEDGKMSSEFCLNGSRFKDTRSSRIWAPTFEDDDDDDVLYVTCQESNEDKANRLGYKFFKSRHDESPFTRCERPSIFKPNYGRNKVSRPSLSRGHNLTLHESFRLDDKKQYQELLKKSAPSFGSPKPYNRSSSLFGTPFGSMSVDRRNRSRKLVEAAIQAHLSSKVPCVDLTESSSKRTPFSSFKSSIGHKSSPLVRKDSPILIEPTESEQSSPIVIKDSSDSEIDSGSSSIVFKKPIARTNSLKDVLDSKPICNSKWILALTEKHDQSVKERTKKIEEERRRKQLHGEQNKKIYDTILEERIRRSMVISEPIEIIEIPSDDEQVEFPQLTSEQEEMISRAFIPKPPSQILAKKFNMNITRHDIQSLANLNWLNDEIINFYMNLIMERSHEEGRLKVYATNTFFFQKLITGGQQSLRRWTKKVDIFANDLMLIPIHVNDVHWCMTVIDFRNKAIKYFDSMGGHNQRCVDALLQYLVDEMMDKKKEVFDTEGWFRSRVKGIPQQMNGSDCGMFSCTFAEFSARNAKFTFSQQDMPYLRRKMVYEILIGKLLMN